MKEIINQKLNKKKLKFVFIFGYLFIFTSIIGLMSNQNILYDNCFPNTDSSVFMTIAKGMLSGKVPYRDFFDHKGPFLYLLNYIGYYINGIHGVYIIEFLMLFIAIVFLYLTISKIYGSITSLISTSIGFLLLENCFEGGNLTEEYVLPLISVALYLYTFTITENKIKWYIFIICGGTFGLSLMLRPNMFGVWFVFSAYIVIASLTKKNIKQMIRYIILFFSGAIITVFPFMIYLLYKNAFSDYIYQNFIFNSQYADTDIKGIILNIFNAFYKFSYFEVFAFIFCIVGIFDFKDKKENKTLSFLLLISFIVSILLISISESQYEHYFMVLIPVLTFCFGNIVNKFKDFIFNLNFNLVLKYAIIGICFLCFTANSFSSILHSARSNIFWSTPNDEVFDIVALIEKNADDTDTIQVVGNNCSIYLYTNLSPANKYIYDFPIAYVSDDVHLDFIDEWNMKKATYVVVPKNSYSNNFETSEDAHTKWISDELKMNYTLIVETENYYVYTKK